MNCERRAPAAATRWPSGGPPELAKALGNYPDLGRSAHQRIKGSTLVTFAELGHSPQVQDPVQFNKTLLKELSSLK